MAIKLDNVIVFGMATANSAWQRQRRRTSMMLGHQRTRAFAGRPSTRIIRCLRCRTVMKTTREHGESSEGDEGRVLAGRKIIILRPITDVKNLTDTKEYAIHS